MMKHISIYNNKGTWEAYENYPNWDPTFTDRHQEWVEQVNSSTAKPIKVLNPEVLHPALQKSNSIIGWSGGYRKSENGIVLLTEGEL